MKTRVRDGLAPVPVPVDADGTNGTNGTQSHESHRSPISPIRGKQTARSFSLWRSLRCVRSPLWSEELHDDREKYGREKDPEQSHTNHPGKYGGAQGLAGLGAWPFRDR